MTKDIENHMVLPYADDDPLPERPEEDPDESRERDLNIRDFRERHRSDNMRIETLAAKLLKKELEKITRAQK